jgi:hypothetical protein
MVDSLLYYKGGDKERGSLETYDAILSLPEQLKEYNIAGEKK